MACTCSSYENIYDSTSASKSCPKVEASHKILPVRGLKISGTGWSWAGRGGEALDAWRGHLASEDLVSRELKIWDTRRFVVQDVRLRADAT